MNRNFAVSPAASPPFQFGLRYLLGAATLVCVTCGAWRTFGGPAIIVPLTALMICVGGHDLRGAVRGAGIGLSAFAHAVVAGLSYDVFGFSVTFFSYAALLLYLPAVVMYLIGKHSAALRWSAAITLLLVARHAVWSTRLALLNDEVKRIVRFAEQRRREAGEYPENLNDYVWKYRCVENYVEYSHGPFDDIVIYFRPSPAAEPHWYSSRSGYGYEAD